MRTKPQYTVHGPFSKGKTMFPVLLLFLGLFSLTCSTTTGLRTELVHKSLYFRPEGTREIEYLNEPEELTLLSYPTGGDSPVGAVIFIHGGGWAIQGPDMPLFQDWVEELDKRGLKAFSIEHRTSPAYRGLDPIEDSIQAFRYIQTHASDFNIPPDRIAIMGFSSGGHIAVMTGLELTRRQQEPFNEDDPDLDSARRSRSQSYPPVAVVSFYAPMEPGELYQVGSPGIRTILERYLPDPPETMRNDAVQKRSYLKEKFLEISPGARLHRNAPPMLLIHGQRDRLVPATQSISFYWKARKIGLNSTRLILVARGDHNFNQSRNEWARQTERQALDYILERLNTED